MHHQMTRRRNSLAAVVAATVGVVMVLGGPILFLLGETFFRVRMIGSANAKRLTAIAVLGLLGILAGRIPALVLVTIVAAVLVGLAIWEYDRAQAPEEELAEQTLADRGESGSWA